MGAAPDLDVGPVLADRYRLDDVLGQGGMATVHRAHDLVLDRDVAVKLFPPVAEGADELQRHQAEMRVLARLNHPGLVTLHDAGSVTAGGPLRQTYLVMELVVGRTLADRLHDGPLTPGHVAHLGRQVAEALVVVHAAGVVHRDIKPANVLLAEAGDGPDERLTGDGHDASAGELRVKLADFGIARLSDGARLTVTGTTLGTASYLSPEQATGSAIGPTSDVYSLGLVLLECLTGERAFTGTMLEAAAARLTSSPVIPGRFGSAWADVLSAMTARSPGDRPSAAEVAVRLAVLGGEPAGAGALSPPTVAAPVVDPPFAPPPTAAAAAVPASTAPVRAAVPASTAPVPAAVPASTVPVPAGPPSPAAGVTAEMPTTSADVPPVPAADPRPDGVADRRARRGTRLAAAALLLCVGGAAVLATQASDDAPPVVPSYPTVEGGLGDALQDLQRSVQP
ncbi:serine/threonine-protein kinase [Cellulomonas cellasea]|uniref:non-specific serine/threonine protein kinase n=1 Tax=Cellulomonas cellasea TaxID=43670 RepID=A0A4Y3KY02_9CELL|nr:serine/threonine-protein kinase [Cellulomonas cellasea]GEA88973.1 hypothetical protein CCE01nite_29220 [Cellulomonas cellasea]